MDIVELQRLLHNLIRLGTIARVDHARARVRVQTGELLTGWLLWLEGRAGTTRSWNPPTVGEQVVVLSPGGDPATGVVLGALYRDAHPAPAKSGSLWRWNMPDGAVIEYNHANSHLSADLPGTASLTAPGGATINADTVINGRLAVNGASLTHNDINVGDTHIHVCPSCRGTTTGPS